MSLDEKSQKLGEMLAQISNYTYSYRLYGEDRIYRQKKRQTQQ